MYLTMHSLQFWRAVVAGLWGKGSLGRQSSRQLLLDFAHLVTAHCSHSPLEKRIRSLQSRTFPCVDTFSWMLYHVVGMESVWVTLPPIKLSFMARSCCVLL